MSVLCLLVEILLCSAELFCDKLLTQQQQQQPLFLRLSFCRSLYSTCLLPFHSCLGMVWQLFFFPCLFCHILSYHMSSLFLSFSLPFLSCPILYYPILYYCICFSSDHILSFVSLPVSLLILSVHIFLHPFCLSCPILSYTVLSYAFVSLIVSLLILSFHILSHPNFSYHMLSYPMLLHSFWFLCLFYPFIFLHPSFLSFHIFSHPFFLYLFYLILSTAVASLLFLCTPFSSSLLFLSCRLGFYFQN